MKLQFQQTDILGIAARIILAAAVFWPLFIAIVDRPSIGSRFIMPTVDQSAVSSAPLFRESFVSDEEAAVMVHSAAVAQFADGIVRSIWFQGSREGGGDVALFSSTLDPSSGNWSQPKLLVDRQHASEELGRRIKTIGNPVLFTAANRRSWLFFVTVSLFGWSGGDVNYKYTDDNGQTWSPAKRLLVSPIPHSGTLVKGSAVEYGDGSIGLPVYRSYDQYSFAEFVHLANDGTVLGTSSISNGTRGALQPSVAVYNANDATAMMRYSGDDPKRILRSTTSDAGSSWITPEKIDLPNPDSALTVMDLSDGTTIMVFNNSTEYRNVLSLARSTDAGLSWKIVFNFDQAEAASEGVNEERSYPSMARGRDGLIHLVYTWKRKRIKHVVFNEAWAETIGE